MIMHNYASKNQLRGIEPPMKLVEFYDMLENHDWYFSYSDDRRVFNDGSLKQKQIEAIAEQSPEHKELYILYREHKFTGKPWGTEQTPKPERPHDEKN